MLAHPASAAEQSCQQAFYRQVCIELGPVQANAVGRDFNVGQFGWACVGEALGQLRWK